LKSHAEKVHKRVTKPEYFSRGYGFYLAVRPKDYARCVGFVPLYDDEESYALRKLMRKWAEQQNDSKALLTKLNEGWKQGGSVAAEKREGSMVRSGEKRKRDESTIADTPDFAYEDNICVGEEPMEQGEREDTRRVSDRGDETVGSRRSGVRPEHSVHVRSSVNARKGRQIAKAGLGERSDEVRPDQEIRVDSLDNNREVRDVLEKSGNIRELAGMRLDGMKIRQLRTGAVREQLVVQSQV